MTLRELLDGVRARVRLGGDDAVISGVAHDSRKVRPGFLFVALAGSHTDGNRYVRDAVKAGAAAILSELGPPPAPVALLGGTHPCAWVQTEAVLEAMGRIANRFYREPSSRLTLVGVTGTNGKTTTTYFLESVFAACGHAPGVIGTISHRAGPLVLEKAANTTPFSLDLIRLLAEMESRGVAHVAMEVSSHALATERVSELFFDAAVLTNIQSDHLDFHKTPEAYFEAKARLFELLARPASPKRRRVAALNADDPASARIAKRLDKSVRALTYGLREPSDVAGISLRLGTRGAALRLRHQGKDWPLSLRLLGGHNVSNALAAAAAALGLGLPMEGVLKGLGALERVPGRLEAVDAGQDFTVLVDYAHTEGALAAALAALGQIEHRRIVTVFGCGGERDAGKRGPMGAAAAAASDRVLLTSDNPRGEDPALILAQIAEGARRSGRENYKIIPDRAQAIREAIREARAGDIVLIAGKGHEETQLLREGPTPFNDARQALEALRESGYLGGA